MQGYVRGQLITDFKLTFFNVKVDSHFSFSFLAWARRLRKFRINLV